MKRRLIIARSLIHQPRLLILDEPTAGVDVDLRKSLWQFLKQINEEGTTILLTTHYIEEAEALCNRIGIIDHGKVIDQDTTRNMSNRLCHESMVVTFALEVDDTMLNHLAAFDPKVNGDRFEITLTFNKTESSCNQVLQQVLAMNKTMLSVRPIDNRLERVFLDLTQDPS